MVEMATFIRISAVPCFNWKSETYHAASRIEFSRYPIVVVFASKDIGFNTESEGKYGHKLLMHLIV